MSPSLLAPSRLGLERMVACGLTMEEARAVQGPYH